MTCDREPITPKGRLWSKVVMGLLRKYPPVTNYDADRIPENPGEVEVEDEKKLP